MCMKGKSQRVDCMLMALRKRKKKQNTSTLQYLGYTRLGMVRHWPLNAVQYSTMLYSGTNFGNQHA